MLNQKDLINKVKTYNPFLSSETLSKAYSFALNAHKHQKRDSGDPYLIHPVAVADILSDLKLDSATIATGLLHDTIEDTKATYKTIVKEFGKEVADLVDGVTKISEFENQAISNSKAENFRKLILATSKDIRVLLVKLADRLHNMRTIKVVDKEKQIRKAKETMEIYAPLADRMGMHRIRDELEDLSFEVLNEDARKLIKDRLDKIKENNLINFNNISDEFDYLVAMDSLIHYDSSDGLNVLSSLSEKIKEGMIFTFAPRTFFLGSMHTIGRLFPRSDRAPSIEPIAETKLWNLLDEDDRLSQWSRGRAERVKSGFYISQACELVRC